MRRALLQRTSQRQSRDQQQSFPPGRTDLLQHLALVLELQLNNLAELEAQQQPVDHGITDESFDAIPTVRAGDIGLGDQQCTICMGDFEEDDTLKVLPCSELHAFHSECIQRWLNKQSSCPLCRNECGERRVPPPPEPVEGADGIARDADGNPRGLLPLEDLLAGLSPHSMMIAQVPGSDNTFLLIDSGGGPPGGGSFPPPRARRGLLGGPLGGGGRSFSLGLPSLGGSSSQSSQRDRERERFEPFFGFGSGPLRPLGLLQPQRRTDLDEDYDEEDDALSEDDEEEVGGSSLASSLSELLSGRGFLTTALSAREAHEPGSSSHRPARPRRARSDVGLLVPSRTHEEESPLSARHSGRGMLQELDRQTITSPRLVPLLTEESSTEPQEGEGAATLSTSPNTRHATNNASTTSRSGASSGSSHRSSNSTSRSTGGSRARAQLTTPNRNASSSSRRAASPSRSNRATSTSSPPPRTPTRPSSSSSAASPLTVGRSRTMAAAASEQHGATATPAAPPRTSTTSRGLRSLLPSMGRRNSATTAAAATTTPTPPAEGTSRSMRSAARRTLVGGGSASTRLRASSPARRGTVVL